MKILLPTLLLLLPLIGLSQEYESDLFSAGNTSSLHLFKASEKSKLTVTTYRKSDDNGNVVETIATYRKGKINPERLNYNIKYTEHYAVEDRKKSLGKFEFRDGRISKYERTDFDSRNARMYTLYFNFIYANDDVVEREDNRTKEYVASGSVDFDTVVVHDTVRYKVTDAPGGFRQDNLSDPGTYIIYEVSNGQVLSKTSYIEGFIEKISYTYDSKGHLVKIVSVLSNDEGGSSTTKTELHYSIDGLLDETKFYDDSGDLLERKTFVYK